ncbi:uncharacterized protein FFMR_12325 [Fusarium fujikuroi]|nr:uncharacterized protein FFMR_12325 [Fusarium fujikuroi]
MLSCNSCPDGLSGVQPNKEQASQPMDVGDPMGWAPLGGPPWTSSDHSQQLRATHHQTTQVDRSDRHPQKPKATLQQACRGPPTTWRLIVNSSLSVRRPLTIDPCTNESLSPVASHAFARDLIWLLFFNSQYPNDCWSPSPALFLCSTVDVNNQTTPPNTHIFTFSRVQQPAAHSTSFCLALRYPANPSTHSPCSGDETHKYTNTNTAPKAQTTYPATASYRWTTTPIRRIPNLA